MPGARIGRLLALVLEVERQRRGRREAEPLANARDDLAAGGDEVQRKRHEDRDREDVVNPVRGLVPRSGQGLVEPDQEARDREAGSDDQREHDVGLAPAPGVGRAQTAAQVLEQGAGDRPAFPPGVLVAVKAFACELPHEHKLPLSRLSIPEIGREAVRRGLVASIGDTTLWRWLREDAICLWSHRSWIFPRDPAFEPKAARVLDLYEGRWQGRPLAAQDCVLSTNEKTSIQARKRIHRTAPPARGRPMRVEHECQRTGAWAHFAAWDVRRAKIHGRTKCSAARLRERWPTIIGVHTPVHASWLHQVEIYFSVLQRKALTPDDFALLGELEERLFAFGERYEQVANPFEWKFTRRDLRRLLRKLREREHPLAAAA